MYLIRQISLELILNNYHSQVIIRRVLNLLHNAICIGEYIERQTSKMILTLKNGVLSNSI